MIEDLKALMEVFTAELELLDKTAKNYKTEAVGRRGGSGDVVIWWSQLAQSDRGEKLKVESVNIVKDVSDKWDKLSRAALGRVGGVMVWRL